MKLYYTTNSPFARKALIVALEHKLGPQLEKIPLNPWADGDLAAKVNPVGKIPALVTDDGVTLYDSPVICEYFDSIGSGPQLFPPSGKPRWLALRRSALGDALLDAMISRRMESRRPDGERSKSWMDRQKAVVERCLDAMEAEAGELPTSMTIGHVTWLCALAHLDFRFADEPWRSKRPRLAAWYKTIAERDSAIATIPHD
jgi:glutathione S-transferase